MPSRRRRELLVQLLALVTFIAFSVQRIVAQEAKPREQPRTPARILAHYMCWYEAKPYSPHWGWHWTMGAFDPEGQKGNQPAIASHYRPLIGPYGSGDPDVIEYHALLMRLSGIDGVILDWYGRTDYFDYASIHRHAAAFVEQAIKSGLEIAVCYEDQTIAKLVEGGRLKSIERVEHARREIDWLSNHWFRETAYLKVDDRPVFLSFGHDGLTDDEWKRVLDGSPGKALYLSEHVRRTGAAGAFDWPVPRVGTKAQDVFYKEASRWPVAMAVAFPRFHDIYEQAKVHKSWGTIGDNSGKTFVGTLETALKSDVPFIQVSTWNDWGEGTFIEPSVEFGYRDLEVIARLRRQFIQREFTCAPDDLRLPLRLYQLRKHARKRGIAASELDELASLLAKRALQTARDRLTAIEKEMPDEP
jgi:hypothetical protein